MDTNQILEARALATPYGQQQTAVDTTPMMVCQYVSALGTGASSASIALVQNSSITCLVDSATPAGLDVIGVSGIGPKGALSVMDIAPIETLQSAIAAGDTSYLTKVSGVGKKIAGKIVLELRDKIGSIGSGTEKTKAIRHEDLDVLEALKSLGYREHEAREAIKEIPSDTSGTSQKITEALKLLGRE